MRHQVTTTTGCTTCPAGSSAYGQKCLANCKPREHTFEKYCTQFKPKSPPISYLR
jgi:hypothetical protein